MHKDDVIATVSNTVETVINEELCPHSIRVGSDILNWITKRIPLTDKLTTYQLGIFLEEDMTEYTSNLIKSNNHLALVLDNCWLKEDTEEITYKEVRQNLIDQGEINFNYKKSSFITEKYGEFEIGRCEFEDHVESWKYIDDTWYYCKELKEDNAKFEYYTYEFLTAIGFSVVERRVLKENNKVFIAVKDFTNNAEYDFESMGIIDKADRVLRGYVDIVLGYFNNSNIGTGILRNSLTGELVEDAPWYNYGVNLPKELDISDDEIENHMMGYLNDEEFYYVLRDYIPHTDLIKIATEKALKAVQSEFKESEDGEFNIELYSQQIVRRQILLTNLMTKISQNKESVTINFDN
jgi:hypothetical protein